MGQQCRHRRKTEYTKYCSCQSSGCPATKERVSAPFTVSKFSCSHTFLSTEFTVSCNTICEKITSKNSGCLSKLLELGLNGDIELHKEITKDDLEILGKIGDGNAGSVYKARYEGELVGVKFFSKGTVINSQDFLRELGLLSLIKHPLVVSCYGGCTVPGNEFIVTELMESNVYEVLQDENFQMDYEMKLSFAISIAKCMNFLHSCGVIHRDLKSLNLLVSKNYEVKICDFGLSKVIDSNKAMTNNVGTVAWISPEVFGKKNYTEKADVYSYGIILWELITRQMPFGNVEAFTIPLMVSRGERPEIPKDCPLEWKKLIKSCWHQKSQMRPSFKKVLFKLRDMVTKYREEKIARGEALSLPQEREPFIRNTLFLQENFSSDERGSSMVCCFFELYFNHFHPFYTFTYSYYSHPCIRHQEVLQANLIQSFQIAHQDVCLSTSYST